MMLTGLTDFTFVPSNKVIMIFRHSYSEECACFSWIVLFSKARKAIRNYKFEVFQLGRWEISSVCLPKGNFKRNIRIAFLEIYLRLIVLGETGSRSSVMSVIELLGDW